MTDEEKVKVVFLDFDGPIIPIQSHQNKRGIMEKAWPPCVAALNRITDSTGAKIVISSTWRGTNGGRDAIDHLKRWGITGEVAGVTPIMDEPWNPNSSLWKAPIRGNEIQAWLDGQEIEAFVILDDDDDMGHLAPFLIQTPFEVGLTEVDADKAIEMLTRKLDGAL